jgi:hypothetical protein
MEKDGLDATFLSDNVYSSQIIIELRFAWPMRSARSIQSKRFADSDFNMSWYMYVDLHCTCVGHLALLLWLCLFYMCIQVNMYVYEAEFIQKYLHEKKKLLLWHSIRHIDISTTFYLLTIINPIRMSIRYIPMNRKSKTPQSVLHLLRI